MIRVGFERSSSRRIAQSPANLIRPDFATDRPVAQSAVVNYLSRINWIFVKHFSCLKRVKNVAAACESKHLDDVSDAKYKYKLDDGSIALRFKNGTRSACLKRSDCATAEWAPDDRPRPPTAEGE
ncbi:hypothetical protein EVAR_74026_1 [Eumeta japonica]|uniref:Uncharacterized protein n=1 Tax=Eumeta variegata TaxID=151549 RepID=A0A4C1TEI5_EUMVA|nr:hypothetical protein EVAR_74026_1 [Eumeta japonica]